MKSISAWRCLAASFLLAPAALAQGFLAERVEAVIDRHLSQAPFRGDILVAKGDRIVFRERYRAPDDEAPDDEAPDDEAPDDEAPGDESRAASPIATRFCIASLTKQWTASAVLRFVEAGALRLHEPVGVYLPELRGPVGERVTLHHLLTHTAGLPWGVEALTAKGPHHRFTLAEIVRLCADVELVAEPGARFAYSDLGYVLCAAVLEAVAGRSYGAVLDEHFFQPLEMVDTGDESVMADAARAVGHVWADGELRARRAEDKSYVTGAGSVWSTVDDLWRWCRAVQTGRILAGSRDQLLSAKVDDYGYGWRCFAYGSESQPRRGVSHTGHSRDGFSSALRWYLDDEIVVVLLGNAHFEGKAALLDAIGRVMVPPLGDAREEAVDRLFAPWAGPTGPGAAVAVAVDGAVVLERGYGMANLEHGAKITSATVFPIASVSKQFTAFAVAMLAEQGALSLDDDVRDHLPRVPDFGATITLRHLVHHTSGLRDAVELMLLAGFDFRDVFSPARYWNLIENQRELNFAPGTAYEYSNTGYFLLAEVVASVSGLQLGGWLEREVFTPLGMSASIVVHDAGTVIPNFAYAYEGRRGAFRRSPLTQGVVGGCGVYATAGDLARWLSNFGTRRVGGDAVIERMPERGRLSSGEVLPYAFGLSIDDYRGRQRWSHGGRSNGYLSHVAYFPDQRVGVAVLCNGYPMTPLLNPAVLADDVADLYLAGGSEAGPDEADDAETEDAATDDAESVAATPAAVGLTESQLRALEGQYWNADRNYTRRVVWTWGELFWQGPSLRQRLVPLGSGRLLLQGSRPRAILSLAPSAAADGQLLLHVESQPPQRFVPVTEPGSFGAERLREYEGVYYSPELRVAHAYRVRDGRLQVESTGREPAPLRPVIHDHFNQGAPWWLGYDIHFVRNAAGVVHELLVSNYHAKRVRFVRL
ncbi:MAG: serine hydrolase domain-containing protein [Planctomycetota bacterium]